MSETDLLIELHKNNPRQGPGGEVQTLKALDFIETRNQASLKIADLGCGTGGQTLILAHHTGGQITAVDLFDPFLFELEKRAKQQGLEKKITTLNASMEKLPFQREEFDIIWSEGAIYNIGFETGIKNWKDFIKSGGFLVISEITWITRHRPKEIENFWKLEYPEIDTAGRKIQILEDHGYTLSGYFYLPQESWWENYYLPLQASFPSFLARHNSREAEKIIKEHQAEMELYEKYKQYYSYGFYIARKI